MEWEPGQTQEFYGKRIDVLFSEPGRPVVVVFQEEPENDQYACLNRDEFKRVCLTKLWSHYHMDYYEVDPKPAIPPIPKDKIAALPDGETKRGALEEWASYERGCDLHEDSVNLLEIVETALLARDGTLAFAVLQIRSDYEYERFDVWPTTIEDPPAGDLLSVKPDWV